MIERSLWTGPVGPVRLEVPVDADACADEIRQLQGWTNLSMYDGKWRTDWRAHSLIGYSRDPLNVNSPFTNMCKVVGQGVARQVEITDDPELLMETTSAKLAPTCLAVANSIPGRNDRVRINYLGPRSIIPKHCDPFHAPKWEDRRVIRIHIGIIVPQGCVFMAWDRDGVAHEICQPTGSAWFLDTDAPHMVSNGTSEGRYNLVIDKFLCPELRALLMLEERAANAKRSARS